MFEVNRKHLRQPELEKAGYWREEMYKEVGLTLRAAFLLKPFAKL